MLLRVKMFMFFTIDNTNFIRFGRLRTLCVHAKLTAAKAKFQEKDVFIYPSLPVYERNRVASEGFYPLEQLSMLIVL